MYHVLLQMCIITLATNQNIWLLIFQGSSQNGYYFFPPWGTPALILLDWELRASYITVLCVQAIMILSPLLFMPSHSDLKNLYICLLYVQCMCM